MTKKHKDSSSGFENIVAIILISIGIGTVIYWIYAGIINIVDRYQDFTASIEHITAIENRLDFMDIRFYNLDHKLIQTNPDGTTFFVSDFTKYLNGNL